MKTNIDSAALTTLLESASDEFLALRVAHALETNDAAPSTPRAFLTDEGKIEVGGHPRGTVFSESDLERNHWVSEVTEELNELTDDQLDEAILEAQCEAEEAYAALFRQVEDACRRLGFEAESVCAVSADKIVRGFVSEGKGVDEIVAELAAERDRWVAANPEIAGDA